MNAAWGQIAGVITVVLMLAFIGIWVWAWRPRHRRKFDSMARIPMKDGAPADDPADDEDERR